MRSSFNRSNPEFTSSVLQEAINRVLTHAGKAIAELPGENRMSESFWKEIPLDKEIQERFSHGFPARFLRICRDFEGFPARTSGSWMGLDSYIFYVQTTMAYRNAQPAYFMDAQEYMSVFRNAASYEDMDDFQIAQNDLIAKFNRRLKEEGYAQDILAGISLPKRQLGEFCEEFGIYDPARVQRYVKRNASFFEINGSEEVLYYAPELGFKIGSDLSIVKKIIDDVKAAPNPFIDVKKIATSVGSDEKSMFLFINKHKSIFKDSASMAPLLSLTEVARQVLEAENSHIVNATDLGAHLSYHLRTNFNVDLNPGQVLRIFKMGLTVDENTDLNAAFKARKEGQKTRVMFAIEDPEKVREANNIAAGVSEIFSQEAVRPKRGDRREAGGRAGLGPQLPKLWNPTGP